MSLIRMCIYADLTNHLLFAYRMIWLQFNFVGFMCLALFWFALLGVNFGFAIIMTRKRELIALPKSTCALPPYFLITSCLFFINIIELLSLSFISIQPLQTFIILNVKFNNWTMYMHDY